MDSSPHSPKRLWTALLFSSGDMATIRQKLGLDRRPTRSDVERYVRMAVCDALKAARVEEATDGP